MMQQEKSDPKDAQVQAILTNPAVYDFLKGMGEETIFDISQD